MEDYKVRQTGPEVQEALDQTTINKNNIATINGKLPEDASPENPLADKSYVDGKVGEEATERQQEILTEKNRAEGAEGSLQAAINNEAQTRQQADGVLDGKIAAEKTRAEGAEGTLQAAINNEAQTRQQADSVLDGKIAAEKTRAEGAEGALQQLIRQVSASLVNYYLKTETYSKAEVNTIIDNVKQFRYQVAATLPTASADTMGIIYLIPSADPKAQNIKEEYLTILDGSAYKWEHIGDTNIDLSGYSTTEQMNAAIASALTNYYTKGQVDALIDQLTEFLRAEANMRQQGDENNAQNITTLDGLVAFINKSFGKYDGEREITLQQAKSGKYVNVNGGETSASGYGISTPVSLNAGDILLVPSASAVPADVSVIARLVDRTYQKVIAYIYTYRTDYPELPATATADYDSTLVYTAVYDESGDTPILTGWMLNGETYTTLPATREVNEQFYEPLMRQAVAAMPSTGYYIYLCPTAMTVVVSGLTETVDGGTALVVGWGIFKNITTNFVGAPGQSVLAQAFAVLFAAIDGLKAQLGNLGETKAVSIDFENSPKLCGQDMYLTGSGAPVSPNVPTMVGQEYLDVTNKKCYKAFSVTGAISDWVLLN